MTAFLVYITANDTAEAKRIGRVLVEEQLAACANVLDGMTSIYRWQGEICEDAESVLITKTTDTQLEALTDRVKELHSYDCPCVAALPITGGNVAFLDWIAEQTKAEVA
ncbi:MAG: divalent cation tolerance protein CutA [Alphaproteobacteria bacterium]|nr:divalent cation tolerance protein CutA [Alphaproteobacteria bacterium]